MPIDELKSLLTDDTLGTPSARIVRALGERGALSATQITGITGLAKSTVSSALSELRRTGMVVDGMPNSGRAAGVGRPATLMTLNPNAGTCVGLMVGVSHMQLIVADVSHAVLSDKAVQLPPDFPPVEAATIAARMLNDAYEENDLSRDTLLGIGIALGGPVNPRDGTVLRAGGMPSWAGVNVRALFEPVLRQTVFADNESNCSAIAEMMWGHAVDCEDFVMFTVDFGVGGAIVSRGQVMRGAAGAAGEFGHMSINPDGELCRCGNRGCLEVYAALGRPVALASRRFARPVSFEEIIIMARDGDIGCQRLIRDTAEIAGRGLAMIGSAINPGLVVLNGRAVPAGELFLEPLAESYDRHTLVKRSDVGEAARTRFVASKFPHNGACLGAVGLVLRHHGRRS